MQSDRFRKRKVKEEEYSSDEEYDSYESPTSFKKKSIL
jgi:hypothetical protein